MLSCSTWPLWLVKVAVPVQFEPMPYVPLKLKVTREPSMLLVDVPMRCPAPSTLTWSRLDAGCSEPFKPVERMAYVPLMLALLHVAWASEALPMVRANTNTTQLFVKLINLQMICGRLVLQEIKSL